MMGSLSIDLIGKRLLVLAADARHSLYLKHDCQHWLRFCDENTGSIRTKSASEDDVVYESTPSDLQRVVLAHTHACAEVLAASTNTNGVFCDALGGFVSLDCRFHVHIDEIGVTLLDLQGCMNWLVNSGVGFDTVTFCAVLRAIIRSVASLIHHTLTLRFLRLIVPALPDARVLNRWHTR
jgi:hypothetical protein